MTMRRQSDAVALPADADSDDDPEQILENRSPGKPDSIPNSPLTKVENIVIDAE